MSEPQPPVALSVDQQHLADRIEAALPQTQCTRCGEPDCRRYAEAIARGLVPINRCPPGGAEGVRRLAAITGHAPLPLDPAHGLEGPRQLAVIDEAACIGCALCIQACPVDCIVGAPKLMHTVIEAQCTGCELCLPACPVDCISLHPANAEPAGTVPATGWAAWSPALASNARQRYAERNQRRAHAAAARALNQPAAAAAVAAIEAAGATARAGAVPNDATGHPASAGTARETMAAPEAAPTAEDRKRAAIAEALRRARLRRAGSS